MNFLSSPRRFGRGRHNVIPNIIRSNNNDQTSPVALQPMKLVVEGYASQNPSDQTIPRSAEAMPPSKLVVEGHLEKDIIAISFCHKIETFLKNGLL